MERVVKIPKWICMENVAGDGSVLLSNNFFHTNLHILLKVQTVMNSDNSIMMGASNLAILVFFKL